jgi:hypothetical protein
MRGKLLRLLWLLALSLLAACNQGGGPAGTLTMDWQPLVAATGPDGTDGPITLTGTLEGNPPGTLELQLAYRPKGGGWGPWQTVAQLQVQGNQVQATIPAPGLDLPVGLDGLGKQVRARVAAGGQTLVQSGDYTLFRYRPLWSQAWGRGFGAGELSANGNLVCGYGMQGFSARVVFCLNPETGATSWTYTFLVNTEEDYVYDIFLAEDGKVYVAQGNRVRVLQDGAELAQYNLSGDFAYVTALAVEGNTLYVAGSRWVNIGCGNILRARLAKYQISGGSLTRLALHDPTPQDLQEITTPGQCSSYRIYNYSSIPALRLEGGKLYALFGIGDVRDNNTGQHISSHCMGFLRLDGATFARDWLTRPTRPGANEESTWQRDCPESSWRSSGTALILISQGPSPQGPSPILWFKDRNFDLGDTQLYALYMGQEVLRKEDGAKETLPGDDPYLLFLPGGFVRFRQIDAYLEARPGGTEGPYRLAGWESDEDKRTILYKDAQGRVYVYGDRNGELRVARIR